MEIQENKDLKQRVVAWLHPEQIKRMEILINSENMRNQTEFVAKAIDFYIGHLNTQSSTTYLSENLLGAINGTLKSTENRMANNLFRLSVEMSIMMNILAGGLDVSDELVGKIRERCSREIKANRGRVSFEDALEYQRGS